MSRPTKSSNHPLLTVGFSALLAGSLLGAGLLPAQGIQLASPEVWITVDTEAFEALRSSSFRFRGFPLASLEESNGVVLTQVERDDLSDISSVMHETFNRCAGFMAHRSLEEARRSLAASARPRVPLGGDYTIDQGPVVAALLSEISNDEILDTIERLSTYFPNRYHQHPSGTAAAQWLRDQWAGHAIGRPDVTVELYSHSGVNQPSVIVTVPGTDLADEVVVLGAHLDSIASGSSNPDFLAPGADDDASGIAVLGEIIRIAMVNDYYPRRTVKFMGYAAEEIGLVGSGDIADEHASDGVAVVAVLQLDMTAYQGSTEDIGILADHTDPVLTAFVQDLISTYQPDLLSTLTTCGYGCSDHASWDDNNFPAAMAFESRFGQHNQALHTTSDTVATLGNSAEHAAKFVALGTAFMVETSKTGPPPLFADGFESGNLSGWTTFEP